MNGRYVLFGGTSGGLYFYSLYYHLESGRLSKKSESSKRKIETQLNCVFSLFFTQGYSNIEKSLKIQRRQKPDLLEPRQSHRLN